MLYKLDRFNQYFYVEKLPRSDIFCVVITTCPSFWIYLVNARNMQEGKSSSFLSWSKFEAPVMICSTICYLSFSTQFVCTYLQLCTAFGCSWVPSEPQVRVTSFLPACWIALIFQRLLCDCKTWLLLLLDLQLQHLLLSVAPWKDSSSHRWESCFGCI